MENERWVFDCPAHGEESEVFCFQAFDETLINNWKKIRVARTEVETSLDERQAHQKGLRWAIDEWCVGGS